MTINSTRKPHVDGFYCHSGCKQCERAMADSQNDARGINRRTLRDALDAPTGR